MTPASRHLYQSMRFMMEFVFCNRDEDPEVIEGFTFEHQEQLNYMMELSGSGCI